MSACAEFAEHVWKPGSCKNCFYPRSAHGQTGTICVRNSLLVEDEDGLSSPSPYSKPTIAVRPTMMNMDVTTTDINMNMEQAGQISSVGLKKDVHSAPLYIDGNGCHRTLFLQNNISGKKEFSSNFSSNLSPTGFSRDCMIISDICVGQEDGRLRGNGDLCRPQTKTIHSTYENGDPHLHTATQRNLSAESSDGVHLRSSVEESRAPRGIVVDSETAPGNGLDKTSQQTTSTSPSPTRTPDSRRESLSDLCSNRSSMDSLTGLPSPQNSPGSGSALPNGLGEPIYAESTKRKRRPPEDEKTRRSPLEICENQRATITVMAAHTEENNCTFYLSSPDSAVSTQWTHFSPAAPKDPSDPAFTWPNTADITDTSSTPSSQPKSQSSPAVPPKINTRSPRLGTSSLSLAPLPELSFHAVLPPKEITCVSSQGDAQLDRKPKSLSSRSLEGRIDEVDEEVEPEERMSRRTEFGGRLGDSFNGPAVWERRSREWSPAETSEGRTTPGTDNNKSSSQTQTGIPAEDPRANETALTPIVSTSSSLVLSNELNAERSTGRDSVPPPPPPKKHHRLCNRLSGSNMDVERLSQPGSVENLNESMRALNCCTNTSTDSLHVLTDTDSTLRSCSSPFPSSPLASAPASPQPDVFHCNRLIHQLQPPPLPQKKLVNRTASAPSQSGVKPLVRARPRLPFGGSETNVSDPDADGRPSGPLRSSDESPERRPPLRSRTLDDPQFRGQGRLGIHGRGSVASSSSPQLNSLLTQASGVTPVTGSTLQLQTLLNNMDGREGIYSKLGGLYAESLRRLALKCEEHFTSSQRNPLRFDESNWSLFKLTCNKPSCLSGDAVYYSASCASDPRNTYAVKICKGQTSDSRQAHLYGLSVQQNIPPHFNLQQECGHFIACVPQSMLPSEQSPSGTPGPSEQERVVVITREVPHQSAADFVKEWESFHRAQPEVYERRVCFLLLQLCTGLEHVKAHGVTHRDLCLENLLLVQHRRSADGSRPDPQQQCLPRLLIGGFAKAKQRSSDDAAVRSDPRLKRDQARLAPEIVSAAQYRKFDEFQTGILIYELLHQRNPFEVTPALRQQEYKCEDLPSVPGASIYSGGLQRLAHLLLEPDPGRRIHVQDAKRVLQSLLWGPRRDLLEQPWLYGGGSQRAVDQPRHEALLNWLDVKRALLMMKFAERSLEPERNAELEDWLCCQYFSTANPKSLCQTAELLYNLKFLH